MSDRVDLSHLSDLLEAGESGESVVLEWLDHNPDKLVIDTDVIESGNVNPSWPDDYYERILFDIVLPHQSFTKIDFLAREIETPGRAKKILEHIPREGLKTLHIRGVDDDLAGAVAECLRQCESLQELHMYTWIGVTVTMRSLRILTEAICSLASLEVLVLNGAAVMQEDYDETAHLLAEVIMSCPAIQEFALKKAVDDQLMTRLINRLSRFRSVRELECCFQVVVERPVVDERHTGSRSMRLLKRECIWRRVLQTDFRMDRWPLIVELAQTPTTICPGCHRNRQDLLFLLLREIPHVLAAARVPPTDD